MYENSIHLKITYYIYMYACIYIYIYMYMIYMIYIYVYIYIYIYIYIYLIIAEDIFDFHCDYFSFHSYHFLHNREKKLKHWFSFLCSRMYKQNWKNSTLLVFYYWIKVFIMCRVKRINDKSFQAVLLLLPLNLA